MKNRLKEIEKFIETHLKNGTIDNVINAETKQKLKEVGVEIVNNELNYNPLIKTINGVSIKDLPLTEDEKYQLLVEQKTKTNDIINLDTISSYRFKSIEYGKGFDAQRIKDFEESYFIFDEVLENKSKTSSLSLKDRKKAQEVGFLIEEQTISYTLKEKEKHLFGKPRELYFIKEAYDKKLLQKALEKEMTKERNLAVKINLLFKEKELLKENVVNLDIRKVFDRNAELAALTLVEDGFEKTIVQKEALVIFKGKNLNDLNQIAGYGASVVENPMAITLPKGTMIELPFDEKTGERVVIELERKWDIEPYFYDRIAGKEFKSFTLTTNTDFYSDENLAKYNFEANDFSKVALIKEKELKAQQAKKPKM